MTLITPELTKQLVDEYISQLFERRIKAAAMIGLGYGALWQAIKQVYDGGGKRLRPYLTLLAYQAVSGNEDVSDILPTAAAQELLHQALLLHDDIIDRDLVRHGVDNVTGIFMKAYAAALPDTVDRRHYAESAALLAGDLLIAEAYDLMDDRVARDQLHQSMVEVIGGELLDTEAAFTAAPADPLVIARYKTASYSFIGPLLTGARVAGANQDRLSTLHAFGETVGIGFQLRDDLLGVFGDEAVTGKSSQGDIREGKRTLLITEFESMASKDQRQTFQIIFGNAKADDDMVNRARLLLVESGARDAIEAKLEALIEESRQQVNELAVAKPYTDALLAIAGFCLNRSH